MKKFYYSLFITLFGITANAQIVNIPNANFKAVLLESGPGSGIALNSLGAALKIDANNDGNIQLSEALQVYSLSIQFRSLTDITGIESFTNLRTLNCYNNEITSLDLHTLVNLTTLACTDNQLTSLNISGLSNLELLYCYRNQLTSLDVSGLTNVEVISCAFNHIGSLAVGNFPVLSTLSCSDNSISSLTLGVLPSLTNVSVYNNLIPALDLSGAPNIESITCYNNSITTLNLAGLSHLTNVNCNNNQLSAIDLSGANALYGLSCSNNHLTTLSIGNLVNLNFLVCSGNLLTDLNLNGLTTIEILTCANNLFTTIDVSGLPLLNSLFCKDNANLSYINMKNGKNEDTINFLNCPNLRFVCADEDQVSTVQNLITTYGYASCNTNPYCTFDPGGTFYSIEGIHRWDTDNNGCDNTDFLFPNMKINVSDGTINSTLISANDGTYHYEVPTGTYTITPVFENLGYFNVNASSSGNIVFPTAASPYTRNFCVSANSSHNDLEVAVVPLNAAIPGFDAVYKIIYKNKGTTIQNGVVSLGFNDPIEDFVSSVPNFDSQSVNNLNWNFTNLLPFETREIVATFNINSTVETPPVNPGNLIGHSATVTGAVDETPTDNTSELTQTVVNSLDPNDKICIEGNNLPVNEVGKYLHYIIHFENTGTANAQNIVVKDIIDTTKFDINTLVPLSGSHIFETKISSTNKVEFIFENINLPFDNASNDGYVAFKIKTLPTLVEGETINNSASIYFDYNAPIVTDTYSVNVYNPLSIADPVFESSLVLSPIPAKDTITITKKEPITISSLGIYNIFGQLIQVVTNPEDVIDVSGLATGNYFIKVRTDRGTATSKFIKE